MLQLDPLIFIISFIVLFILVIFQLYFTVKIFKRLKAKSTEEKSDKKKLIETDTKEKELKDEVMNTVLLSMLTIRNTVLKQTMNIHAKAIERAPHSLPINEVNLSKYVSTEKILIVHSYWNLFQQYINNYWLTKNNHFKTVFTGDIAKKSGDVGTMMLASEELVSQLDQLIKEFQKENNEFLT